MDKSSTATRENPWHSSPTPSRLADRNLLLFKHPKFTIFQPNNIHLFTALRTRPPVSPPPSTKSQHPHRRRTGKQERSTKTAIYENSDLRRAIYERPRPNNGDEKDPRYNPVRRCCCLPVGYSVYYNGNECDGHVRYKKRRKTYIYKKNTCCKQKHAQKVHKC